MYFYTEDACTAVGIYVPKWTVPIFCMYRKWLYRKNMYRKCMYRNCHVLKATYPKNRYGADADGGACWRHLVNTIEPSVCGSDVKLLFTVTVVCCLVSFRSDADPDVLAKYVMALVKKDKPVNELISTCQAQLDIFLQKSKHISFCYHVLCHDRCTFLMICPLLITVYCVTVSHYWKFMEFFTAWIPALMPNEVIIWYLLKALQFLLFPLVFWHSWLGVRKSIQPVKIVMRCWHGYLSGARCKWFAYGPADATATQSSRSSLKSIMV